MKSAIVKRSIVIDGRKSSVSLEDPFWIELKRIAANLDMTLSDLISAVDNRRQEGNLSSALRLFVLEFYRNHPAQQRTGPDPLVTPGAP